ncbi:hypothetical protein R1sor_016164 [Riccia sorocarpa]|uniref:Uncharacterized protein n=1 Tax=Riccia sorocarpa TaxID=122646 RepID=A0ABD3HIB6_9MARC
MASPFVRTLLGSRASCIARASGALVIHQSSRNGRWKRNWQIRGGLECGSVIARGFSRDSRKLNGNPRGPFSIAAASKRAPASLVKEDVEDESELEEQEEDGIQSEDDGGKGKIGRNASKKQSAKARVWGRELATLSPSQLRQACKWASLEEDVYDAVMLVKDLGTSHKVKHGRRRQYNYIGGLLRDVDPETMESVLKAIKDGDVEGLVFVPSGQPDDVDAELEVEVEDEEAKENGTLQQAETWCNGLVAGDRAIEDEVYSIYDVDFDRQELRKMVREVRKYEGKSAITSGSEEAEVGQAPSEAEISTKRTKRERAEKTLLYFLLKLVKERRDNVQDLGF